MAKLETDDIVTIEDSKVRSKGKHILLTLIPPGISNAMKMAPGDHIQWMAMNDGTIVLVVKRNGGRANGKEG